MLYEDVNLLYHLKGFGILSALTMSPKNLQQNGYDVMQSSKSSSHLIIFEIQSDETRFVVHSDRKEGHPAYS